VNSKRKKRRKRREEVIRGIGDFTRGDGTGGESIYVRRKKRREEEGDNEREIGRDLR